jgi:hypothetical protein
MSNASLGGSVVSVPFHSIRNISSPEDVSERRTIYAGQMPVSAITKLDTHDNVRGYLVEAEGKQTRMPTQVHKAIRETLSERPSVFSVLNSGVVIVAKQSETDEKTRVLKLTDASIINGSQTRGVVNDHIKRNGDVDTHIKFELIVTDDEDLVADISIARNFQNDVQLLSISGRKGELDELEASFKKTHPKLRLSKSESQRPNDDNDLISTEKLLQVLAALLPAELWWKQGDYNKTYTYSAKATCLKDFRRMYEIKTDPEASGLGPDDRKAMIAVYQYNIDMAGLAWTIYERWKSHPSFKGTGLRSIERDDGEIVDVPDGIVFPILAALSNFVVFDKRKWTLEQPELLNDEALIASAKRQYMEIAKSKPEIMGKSKACYSGLEEITAIYKLLLQQGAKGLKHQ